MSEAVDFSNFKLDGVNVYETADGVIPEIAERFGIALSDEPNSAEMSELVGLLGKNKVLRDNQEVTAIDGPTAIDLVQRSGVQRQVEGRSLWTPDITSDMRDVDTLVATGGVANWIDRTGELIVDGMSASPNKGSAYFAAGNRVMSSASDKSNLNLSRMSEWLKRYPTEAEYVGGIIVPRIAEVQDDKPRVIVNSFDTGNGGEIAKRFFETNPHLLGEKLEFNRVANAGIQLAVQMRAAAREIDPSFDSDPENPQVFIYTDEFPLASNSEEEADPAHFQKPHTALRQAALTAKLLHEAAGGE